MKIEDIDVIQKSLNILQVKRGNLLALNEFLEDVKEHNCLDVMNNHKYLSLDGVKIFEYIGKEIVDMLESKKTILEKEIYNYNLTDLLPIDYTVLTKDPSDDIEPFYSKYDIYERIQLESFDKAIRIVEGVSLIPCVNYTYDAELNAGEISGCLNFTIQYVSSDGKIAEYKRQIPVEINTGVAYIDYTNIKYDVTELRIDIVGMRCVNVTAKLTVLSS